MGKLLILIIIVLIAFWMGRLSVSSGKNKTPHNNSRDKGNIIDIEVEGKTKSE